MKFVIQCDRYVRREVRHTRKSAADALYKMVYEMAEADGALDTLRGQRACMDAVYIGHALDAWAVAPKRSDHLFPIGWTRQVELVAGGGRGAVVITREE